mgnify:CR=1 FL=1
MVISTIKKHKPTPVTILLVILFVVLYVIGSYTRFNFLDIIYRGHPIPIWCVVCLIVLLALLWNYNRIIGILYGILILFQLKRVIINAFVGDASSTEVKATPTNTTPMTIDSVLMNQDDDRFKTDDVKIREIIRQIQAELDFDPYKTPLARQVIIDVYKRYFNNDMFVKLNEITENSKKYQKEYRLLYMPQPTELNYSIDVADLLSKSSGFGVNPQIDKPLGVGDAGTTRS